MCVIIAKPARATITETTIRRCWQRNSDGAGFAVIRNGKVKIHKGFMALKDLIAALEKNTVQTEPVLMHFRIATHGSKDETMTHPFRIRHDLVVAHNGILTGTQWRDDHLSDTALFTQKVLKKLPHGFHLNPAMLWLLDEYCQGSKLAFLDASGRFQIVNKHLGVEEDGVWYSNTSFRGYGNVYGYDGWPEDDDYYYDLRQTKTTTEKSIIIPKAHTAHDAPAQASSIVKQLLTGIAKNFPGIQSLLPDSPNEPDTNPQQLEAME